MSLKGGALSLVPIYAAWASMEADDGQLDAARTLIEEGLALQPDHTGCLLALVRLERLCGDLVSAQAAMERVFKARPGFNSIEVRLWLYSEFIRPSTGSWWRGSAFC